jgi:hypothetical protein
MREIPALLLLPTVILIILPIIILIFFSMSR